MKQKRAFCKIFCSIKIFLELQNLDDLVNFSELSMFVNASHIYWIKWTGGLGREKKKCLARLENMLVYHHHPGLLFQVHPTSQKKKKNLKWKR